MSKGTRQGRHTGDLRPTYILFLFCFKNCWNSFIFFFLKCSLFIFLISWRLITLQYCSGYCHILTWISHGFTCIPHTNPTSHLPLHPIPLGWETLWVFPVHQVWALVSCIQPGLVICFTLDNIHVSMMFSWNIPPLPSSTESKSLFCTYLFCCFAYRVIITIFLNSIYMC